jgi:putative oxidoreductase
MLNFMNNPYTMLIGRVLLVLIYLIGGFKLFTGGVPVEFAATKGIPGWMTWIGFAIKFFGGLFVIIGFQTRLAALGLIVFTVMTAFIFHGDFDNVFWKEISMIGGLLVVAAVGPGALSIDERNKS